MRLISPYNVTVSVSDAKGEALKASGYREVEVTQASTPDSRPSPRKRPTPRKPEPSE